MKRAQGVGPGLLEEAPVGGADLGTEERVVAPALGGISDADYAHALKNFTAKRTGTAFGGIPEVGVMVSDLLKREPKE